MESTVERQWRGVFKIAEAVTRGDQGCNRSANKGETMQLTETISKMPMFESFTEEERQHFAKMDLSLLRFQEGDIIYVTPTVLAAVAMKVEEFLRPIARAFSGYYIMGGGEAEDAIRYRAVGF